MKKNATASCIRGLMQSWPLPAKPRPIVLIGAGGIVNDAHLPAYRKAGFKVSGIFDLNAERSRATAEKFGIPRVFGSLVEAFSTRDAVFDIAVPPERIAEVLKDLPLRSTVLIQKPMGKDLADAKRIRRLCRVKLLKAAVNFQLRFSPMMLAVRDALARGLIGPITDVEVRLNLQTPWELFPFLKKLARVEIQVHSVHYLDWIRSVLGEPRGVHAQTLPDPRFPALKSTRTSAILDYGDRTRCCLSINHNFAHGPRHQAAMIRVEGLKGAAVATLGILLNYPKGEPDALEISAGNGKWTAVPLQGGWFPDAFIGTMSSVQRYAAGEDNKLPTSVEDAYRTMALVEACYRSNARGATPIPA